MKFTFLLLTFISFETYAASKFLNQCLKGNSDLVFNLQTIFNTKDCNQINARLSKIKSFSEIILPDRHSPTRRRRKKRLKEFVKDLNFDMIGAWKARGKSKSDDLMSYPWTDDLPYLYGLHKSILKDRYSFETNRAYGTNEKSLENFIEFKNIEHIEFTSDFKYYKSKSNICSILKNFPGLKKITVEKELLENSVADSCIANSSVEGVIIRGRFDGKWLVKPKSKIVGIEYYTGDIKNLADYRSLRFLGITNGATTLEGIERLSTLSRLSHLSLNIKSEIRDVYKIGNLNQLEFLSISCVSDEKINSPNAKSCPQENQIEDITFVSRLPWLRVLNLSFNKIISLAPIEKLERLEQLKIRGNKVFKLPNLSGLHKLKYVDLSGNKIESLEGIESAKSLEFANLSGNHIVNLEPLKKLDKLEYLNISNNPLEGINKRIFFPKLRALNLNGGGGNYDTFKFPSEFLENTLLLETLHFDFVSTPKKFGGEKCKTKPQIGQIDFLISPNLEFLSVKNNLLDETSNFTHFEKLKYLDISVNKYTSLDENKLPKQLNQLAATRNQIAIFPRMNSLNNLKSLDLTFNDISEIDNINTKSLRLEEINLTNNLITDFGVINSNLGYLYYIDFVTHLQLSGNLVPKDYKYCPTDHGLFISRFCKEYLNGENAYIENGLWAVLDYDVTKFIEERTKCGFSNPDL